MMSVESDLSAAAESGVRLPANIMGMLREAYAERENALDWLLASVVVVVMGVVYWKVVRNPIGPMSDDVENRKVSALRAANVGQNVPIKPDPNATAAKAMPDSGISGSLAAFNTVPSANWYPSAPVLTYNLPPSRAIPAGRGPTLTRKPDSPSTQPRFADLQDDSNC
jgi:hypothetical protein